MKHVTQGAEGSYHVHLIRSNLNLTLSYAVNRVGSSPALWKPIIRIWCQLLWPTAFLIDRSRCCCYLLLYDRQHMGNHLNSAGGSDLYPRSWPLSFLHLLSTPSSPWLLSISRASWHIPLGSQQWWQDHLHIGPPRKVQSRTSMTRPPARWWRTGGWVWSPGGPWPSPQTLGCNDYQQGPSFAHMGTFPGLTAKSIPQQYYKYSNTLKNG